MYTIMLTLAALLHCHLAASWWHSQNALLATHATPPA